MRKTFAGLFFLMLITLVSCNRSESQIQSIDAELTLAEQDSINLDKSDLEALGAQLDDLQSDLDANRSNYTDEQIKEVGRLKGRYLALALKRGMKDLNESLKDAGNQLEGFMEGIQQ